MSGKMVNIGGDANDINYRYKMPAMTTKIEGRGNGIKTVLMNIADVAKHMHTEPSYATKFFGMEVGALSQYDNKRNVGVVHGVHQTKDLQEMLQKFIREFILCQKCRLPELQFKIHTKKNVLLQKCASCGWKGSNASNHKVKTYIINHPPVKKKKAKDKDAKKDKKKDRKRKTRGAAGAGDAKEDDDEADYKELGWDNDEVWSVDTSETAVAKRKQEEMATIANKGKGESGTSSSKSSSNSASASSSPPPRGAKMAPAQILRGFIAANRTQSEILDEIRRISLARNFDQKKKLQLVIDALCKLDTVERFVASLSKYKAILATFTENANDAKVFFGVVEEFVLRRCSSEFLDTVYKILLCLYEQDIVGEEDILAWADLECDKAVIVDQEEAERIREKAAPFIKWLRELESASEGSEEESEEDAD